MDMSMITQLCKTHANLKCPTSYSTKSESAWCTFVDESCDELHG